MGWGRFWKVIIGAVSQYQFSLWPKLVYYDPLPIAP
jgi:hypothetical protein